MIDTFNKTLGARFREMRLEAGLSQKTFAHAFDVSTPTISRLESGDRRLTVQELGILADTFGFDIAALLKQEVAS